MLIGRTFCIFLDACNNLINVRFKFMIEKFQAKRFRYNSAYHFSKEIAKMAVDAFL